MAVLFVGDYELEIGRCVPCEDGTQLWYFQAWGASHYPWWGVDGFDSADDAIQAAIKFSLS